MDNLIIRDIKLMSLLSKQLNRFGLITDYQCEMIRKWLITSTKKAERMER